MTHYDYTRLLRNFLDVIFGNNHLRKKDLNIRLRYIFSEDAEHAGYDKEWLREEQQHLLDTMNRRTGKELSAVDYIEGGEGVSKMSTPEQLITLVVNVAVILVFIVFCAAASVLLYRLMEKISSFFSGALTRLLKKLFGTIVYTVLNAIRKVVKKIPRSIFLRIPYAVLLFAEYWACGVHNSILRYVLLLSIPVIFGIYSINVSNSLHTSWNDYTYMIPLIPAAIMMLYSSYIETSIIMNIVGCLAFLWGIKVTVMFYNASNRVVEPLVRLYKILSVNIPILVLIITTIISHNHSNAILNGVMNERLRDFLILTLRTVHMVNGYIMLLGLIYTTIEGLKGVPEKRRVHSRTISAVYSLLLLALGLVFHVPSLLMFSVDIIIDMTAFRILESLGTWSPRRPQPYLQTLAWLLLALALWGVYCYEAVQEARPAVL